jgi:hypothetical protein
MDRSESVKTPINIAPSLPNRRGKRPLTIVSPLHVQCSDHGDDKALRDLVNEVIAWPDIEAGPLPVGSADLISFQVGEDVATGDGRLEIRPQKPPHMQTSLVSQCIAMLSFLSRLEIGSKDGPG